MYVCSGAKSVEEMLDHAEARAVPEMADDRAARQEREYWNNCHIVCDHPENSEVID